MRDYMIVCFLSETPMHPKTLARASQSTTSSSPTERPRHLQWDTLEWKRNPREIVRAMNETVNQKRT